MTTLPIPLSTDEEKWLADWSTMAGYHNSTEGIREVLKTVGAIPRGSDYWKQRFGFAE